MISNTSFGVYVDSETARFHFSQLETVNKDLRFLNHEFCRDLDQYTTQNYKKCVSAFHVPFPKDQSWLERLSRAYAVSKHVFVFCSELHEPIMEQLRSVDLDGVVLYASGVIRDSFAQAQVRPWMDWFHTSSEFYARTCPNFLDSKLKPYNPKPKMFDMLLGNQRTHRDFVFDYVSQNNLANNNLLTYVYHSHKSILDNSQFVMEQEGIEFDPNRDYTHSVDSVKYYGRWMTLSQVVPITVYNQTAYSLVAETNAVNQFNFYTEKIVKPMLGRRLFVVIAGQHYVRNLQNIGFKTFDCVIDESYDSVENDQQRWQLAMQQVSVLCNQDQCEVLEKIKPITEHNYQLVANKNWYREFLIALADDMTCILGQ